MNKSTISSSSLTILEKLKNLISKDSTILKGIDEKKENEQKNKEIKGKEVEEFQNAINTSESNKNKLEIQGNQLTELLKSLNPEDYEYVSKKLDLSFNPKEDIEKLSSLLPQELDKLGQEIAELNDKLKTSEKSMEDSKDLLSELEIRYSESEANRLKLRDLIALSKSGAINKTREEVINILSKNSFNDNQAKEAAKLILFPEDELIPFFEDIEIEDNSALDILEENNSKEEKKETREEIQEEDVTLETSPIIEAPISFDELRESLNNSIESAKEMNLDSQNEEEIQPLIDNYEEKEILIDSDDNQEIEERTIVSNVENAPEIAELGKEITENGNDEEEKELLVSIGKTTEDIELVNDLLEDNNKNDFETMINSLKEYGLDPAKIPLIAYKDGIPTLLANIEFLSQNDYELDGNEMQKFTATLFITSPSQLKRNFEILKSYKIDLKKSNGKLALKPLAMDSNLLLDYIEQLIELDEIQLIRNNQEILTKNCKKIAERLLFCKANEIPYFEEKNNRIIYRSFIYSDEDLNDLVEKKLDLNNIPSKEENNNSLKEIIDKDLVNLLEDYYLSGNYYEKVALNQDDEVYFKYMDLLKKINAMSSTDTDVYTIEECICGLNNTNKNLMYLVTNTINKNEEELMSAALLFNNHKTKDELEIVNDRIKSGK